MRQIICDNCQRIHNTEHSISPTWLTVQRTDREEGEKHFCTLKCLVEWATKRSGEVQSSQSNS